jgi:hypothetical protein
MAYLVQQGARVAGDSAQLVASYYDPPLSRFPCSENWAPRIVEPQVTQECVGDSWDDGVTQFLGDGQPT